MTPLRNPTHITVALPGIQFHEVSEEVVREICVGLQKKLGSEWAHDSTWDDPLFTYSFVTRQITFADGMVRCRFQRQSPAPIEPVPLVEPLCDHPDDE